MKVKLVLLFSIFVVFLCATFLYKEFKKASCFNDRYETFTYLESSFKMATFECEHLPSTPAQIDCFDKINNDFEKKMNDEEKRLADRGCM
jgi:hypothetical protein